MLYTEFLTGIERDHSEGTAFAYRVINKFYMDDKIHTQADCFKMFNQNPDNFLWVDSKIHLTNGMIAEKPANLAEEISFDEAIDRINDEFGFAKEKIIICSTPYYFATDMQYIIFAVRNHIWAWLNGDIYEVSR